MQAELVVEAEGVINRAAWWYARRVWWMDVQELQQEGWVVAMQCANKLGADVEPDHFRAYVYRAVSNRLSRYCWEQSSPVSDSKPGAHLAGLTRAQMPDTVSSGVLDPETEMLKKEAEMLVPHFQLQLRRRITQLYEAETTEPNRPVINGVLLVLIEGEKSAAAAKRVGADVRDIYRTTEWMKPLASRDRLVKLLLANIEARRRDI